MKSSSRSVFYIYTPRWRENAAGIKALHLLCDAINKRGYSAWLVFSNPSRKHSGVNPKLITPVLNRKTMREHAKLGFNVSTVYSETIVGNPLRADRVIRWLLNFPGVLGGPTKFSEKEWIISYSGKIREKYGSDVDVLYLPVIDPEELPKGLSKISGLNVIYAGKFRAFVGKPEIPRDLKYVEIFRDGKKRQPRSEVLKLLGSAECLYIWENSSIAVEAMLMNTPCLFINNPFLGELIAELELGIAGSGFGFSSESLEKARKTLPEFQKLYSHARDNFWKQLDYIINKNETRWGNKKSQKIKFPKYFFSNISHRTSLLFGVTKKYGFMIALKIIKKFKS